MASEWTTPEMIIAISSVVIALCALGTSFWQGYTTRQHNKLSVKPSLNLGYSLSKHSSFIGIEIKNTGIGPLIIKNATISKGGKSFKISDGNFKELFPALCNEDFHFNLLSQNYWLLPGQGVWVVSTAGHKHNPELMHRMDYELQGVLIEVDFECIYQNKYSGRMHIS